jgi:hypothetical protein
MIILVNLFLLILTLIQLNIIKLLHTLTPIILIPNHTIPFNRIHIHIHILLFIYTSIYFLIQTILHILPFLHIFFKRTLKPSFRHKHFTYILIFLKLYPYFLRLSSLRFLIAFRHSIFIIIISKYITNLSHNINILLCPNIQLNTSNPTYLIT